MKHTEEKKLIFVCTGNTCRSPMAEAICRYEIKRRGLNVAVSSAGTNVAQNGGMHLYSLRTLLAHGLSIENFTPTQLTEALLQSSTFIVCMTEEQKQSVVDYCNDCAPEKAEHVFAFSDFCGYSIPDPYGQGMDAYEQTYLALEGGMSALIEKLFVKKTIKWRLVNKLFALKSIVKKKNHKEKNEE